MCLRATCNHCNKASWWGCGKHVPSVMDGVPEKDWCTCTPHITSEGKTYPPMGSKASQLPQWMCTCMKKFGLK